MAVLKLTDSNQINGNSGQDSLYTTQRQHQSLDVYIIITHKGPMTMCLF